MLKLIRNLAGLLLIFPPLYIAIRFFKWSLQSLEKEMTEAASSSKHPDV
jgi:hypothetical protein